MFNIKENNGFASMVEVTVTAVIFILATAGVLSTVSMLRPHAIESSKDVEAAYIGKGIMDDLRKDIDASTWNSGELSVGTHPPITTTEGYTINYTVTEPSPNIRRLDMVVTWPD